MDDPLEDHQMACPLEAHLKVGPQEDHLLAYLLGAHLMVDPHWVPQKACLLEETLQRDLHLQVCYFPHILAFVNYPRK